MWESYMKHKKKKHHKIQKQQERKNEKMGQ